MAGTNETAGSITIKLNLESGDYKEGLTKAEKQTETFADKVKSTFIGATVFKVAQKGWDLVSGSIEKATNRLDSMSKAKQVMSILGGSTEKATAIVNELNDAVTDTAYGLDSAATSTKKLATSGLGLDESANMVKDLMDAISFYGDGTNATLENVVDAMSKMNASGKISADQWQRLTDAGIPVLKIFAEKTGMSMAEVSDAFTKGGISAQDFNNILTDALENGTQSFPAVAGKAKEMAGSFATSFSNMQARIAIGVANVITAFNNFVQDAGLPSLQAMIADFGSVIKNGLNWVADNLPGILNGAIGLVKEVADSMPNLTDAIQDVIDYVQQNAGGAFDLLKDALKWMIDNIPTVTGLIDQMAPVIVAVGAAFATWKFLSTVKKAAELLQVNFLNAIFKVSKGLGALSGHPFMLIVTAIAALVAGFMYLWNTSEDFRNFWINLWDGIKSTTKAVIDGIVTFFTKTIPDAFNAFIDGCKALADTVVTFFTETIPQAISSFVESVIKFFSEDLPYWIGYGLGWAGGKLTEFLISLGRFVAEDIPEFINGVVEWFGQLPGRIGDWLQQTLANLGQWAVDTVNKGTGAASGFLTSVGDWFSQLPGRIWEWLTATISNLGSWVGDMKNKAVEAGTEFMDGLVTEVGKIPGKMLELGGNIVDGIKNGISNAWSGLTGWFGKLAGGLIDGFCDALGIHSPSYKFDKKARWIAPGIVNGLKKTMPKAIKYMAQAGTDMLDAFNADGLTRRVSLEGRVSDSGGPVKGGNTYTVNQTINSHDALSPSEMARETKNVIRRAAWQ